MFVKTSAGREEGEIATIHYRAVDQSWTAHRQFKNPSNSCSSTTCENEELKILMASWHQDIPAREGNKYLLYGIQPVQSQVTNSITLWHVCHKHSN